MEVKNLNIHFLKQYNNETQPIKYTEVLKSPYYEMQVGTTKGRLSKNQSTSIISSHPMDNKLIAMIVVYNNKQTLEGERNAERIGIEINKMFQSINKNYFFNIENIKNILVSYLRGINKKLSLSNEFVLDTSFGVVIKGQFQTLILTIGSATCYVINGNKLEEVETIKAKETVNDKIWLRPDITIIPNNYESLLLTTSILSKKAVSQYADEATIRDSIEKLINSQVDTDDIKYSMHKNRNLTVAMYKNSSK